MGLLQLGVGGVRLQLLLAQARRSTARPQEGLVRQCRELAAATGIRRKVRLLVSPGRQMPFAVGTLRPLLVLPRAACAWPQQRLRAALLHELRHIRRLDPLTQTVSRLVCCLFWFVPLVWFANWFLYAEQEMACDSGAVESGVGCCDYASCLLFAARHSPLRSVSAGLYAQLWRRRILEDRIRSVLASGRAFRRGWPVLAPAALVIGILVLLAGAGWRNAPADLEVYQRFVGTWVNIGELGDPPRSRVLVIRPDHVGEDRPLPASSTVLDGRWTITIRKTWVDDRGGACCQLTGRYSEGSRRQFKALMRVDRAGRVLELNEGLTVKGVESGYPGEIDPELRAYYVYARKK